VSSAFQVLSSRPFRSTMRSSVRRLGLGLGLGLLGLLLLSPAEVRAEGDEMMAEFVAQFRENIDQVRIILADVGKEKNAGKKLAGKRDALERLSRAYIILQRVPAKTQDAEDLGEARRYMESSLKDLGADPTIKKAKDNILAGAVKAYRGGNLQESLGLFEELRLMDPANPGVTFMVRHLGQKVEEEEKAAEGTEEKDEE